VSLTRERAIAGSPAEGDRGAAYVFERGSDGQWFKVWRLVDENAEPEDRFGAAVTIRGYRAVVGAPGQAGGSGRAFVFEPVPGGQWLLRQELVPADPSIVDFGASVDLDFDTAVVGADGTAHVFARDPDTRIWSELRELQASEGEAGLFGHAVGWDGETALVGAEHADPVGVRSGSSYVFALGRIVNAVFPPTLHVGRRGMLPVTILGGADFDVSRIDAATLRLGPAAARPVYDLTDPFVRALHTKDVNGDGRLDLVVHFRSRLAGLTCDGDGESVLVGRLVDGTAIRAVGTIASAGCQSSRGRRAPASR
jgi:hypothetical protein